LIEIGFHLYLIYRFGKIGIIIASTSFVGTLLLLVSAHYNLPPEIVYVSLPLVIASALIAKYYSNLDFDKEGKVIYDPSK
jgi:hypothetical protein